MPFFASGSTRVLSTARVNGLQSQRQQQQPEAQSILDLKRSRNADLFASLTASTLSLWSCRPEVLLASVCRSEDSIGREGRNSSITWKPGTVVLSYLPDSSLIAVATDTGYIHIYSLLQNNAQPKVYEFSFAVSHHHAFGAGERSGCPNISVAYKASVRISAGISS